MSVYLVFFIVFLSAVIESMFDERHEAFHLVERESVARADRNATTAEKKMLVTWRSFPPDSIKKRYSIV